MHTTKLPHSRATFSQLHCEYHDRLLSSMTAMVKDQEAAKDITAMAFAKALENIHQLQGRSSLYTWIHAIAVNESRRWWRHRRPEVSLDCFHELAQREEIPDGANDIERLRMALQELPTIYRNVLRGCETINCTIMSSQPLGYEAVVCSSIQDGSCVV